MNDYNDQGPFQANTRVVAVVALAVAGVFVLLGLILSIARAVQQRTLDRVMPEACQPFRSCSQQTDTFYRSLFSCCLSYACLAAWAAAELRQSCS